MEQNGSADRSLTLAQVLIYSTVCLFFLAFSLPALAALCDAVFALLGACRVTPYSHIIVARWCLCLYYGILARLLEV